MNPDGLADSATLPGTGVIWYLLVPATFCQTGSVIVRALFEFDGLNRGDLSFTKGAKMRVLESNLDGDWWHAEHLTTGAKGTIPKNYVCVDDDTPQAQDWWFASDRKNAEVLLLLPGNEQGTFLVRHGSDGLHYVISVRYDTRTGDPSVKHYEIQQTDDDHFFISREKTFTKQSHGMCTQLVKPCPRIKPAATFHDLEIQREVITFKEKLGAGNFGEVWKGKLYEKSEVAVKTLKKGQMSPGAFLQEARTMHELRHPKLVQLLAVCTKGDDLLIVTEFMANGSLLSFLRKDEGRMVKYPVMINMAAQIADGMAYLEQKVYIHRDLRADNVLVGEHHDVKVADFGLARLLEDSGPYQVGDKTKYPAKWTAPEAKTMRQFNMKSDVWSFGVLLYELVTFGGEPYPGISHGEIMDKVGQGYRMSQPKGCPDELYDLMRECWNQDPKQRPTFKSLECQLSEWCSRRPDRDA
ncbi:hypothetical protein BaRGS_00004723 [Batillaria attramentaria]|uniref:Tyrosine-protein kinase n=1 Tax=Batillaria attramentaria TaxID=370345 RepID=A0ABD0LXS0_9CAEN